jgi:Zn-dependent peptidase ImmA (M78 family)
MGKDPTFVVPKHIDFGFHRIWINVVDEETMREEADCEEGDSTPEGLWNTDLNIIFLLKTLSWRQMRYYLMHELVHACLDQMDSMAIGP